MLIDIDISILILTLIFMLGENTVKPNFIKNYISDYPILRWLIFYLILVKKKNVKFFIVIFILYQILYIIDHIYKINR
jgi:hypothetical protein